MPTEADAYFEKHLDRKFWFGLEVEIREAVLAMAETDIAALLAGASASALQSVSGKKAVFEQAVFLARNHELLTAGKVVTGQSLDGLGSQTFTLLNAARPGVSPRAALLAEEAKRTARPGMVKFGRG